MALNSIDRHEREWNDLQRNNAYREAYSEYITAQYWHLYLTGVIFSGNAFEYELSDRGNEFKKDVLNFLRLFLETPAQVEFPAILNMLSEEVFHDFVENRKLVSEKSIKNLIINGLGRKVIETGANARKRAEPYFPCIYIGTFPRTNRRKLKQTFFLHLLNPKWDWKRVKSFAEKLGVTDFLDDCFTGGAVRFNPYGSVSGTKVNLTIDLTANKEQIVEHLKRLTDSLCKELDIERHIGPGRPFSLTKTQEEKIIELVRARWGNKEIMAEIDPSFKDLRYHQYKDSGLYRHILRLRKNVTSSASLPHEI